MKFLHEQLQQPDYQECLQSFTSPLSNSHRLGNIKYVEKSHCGIMSCFFIVINQILYSPNYRTYPYKRAFKQFRRLQIAVCVILSTSL